MFFSIFQVLVILFIIAVVCSLFLWCVGFFQEVHIKVIPPPYGRLVIAYKYHGAIAENSIIKLFRHKEKQILPDFKTIVIHYNEGRKLTMSDSPKSYAAGIILNEDGIIPDLSLMSSLAEYGYRVAMFPRITHALLTTYPYKNLLAMQMGLLRVYPKLVQYIEHRKLCAHPAVEIYDKRSKTITFMIPLARQDDFYVPEAVPVPEPESDTSYNTSGSMDDF